MKPEIDPKLLNDPVFKRVLEDSLAIQDRFSAEPVFWEDRQGVAEERGSEAVAENQGLPEIAGGLMRDADSRMAGGLLVGVRHGAQRDPRHHRRRRLDWRGGEGVSRVL
jgi:hypothetical protein